MMIWWVIGIAAVLIFGLLAGLGLMSMLASAGFVSWIYRVEGDIQAFRSYVLTALKYATSRKLPILTKLLTALEVDKLADAENDIIGVLKMIGDPDQMDKELEDIVIGQLAFVMGTPQGLQRVTTTYQAALAAINSAAASAAASHAAINAASPAGQTNNVTNNAAPPAAAGAATHVITITSPAGSTAAVQPTA